MRNLFYTFCFIIVFLSGGKANTQSIDSLKLQLETKLENLQKAELHREIAIQYAKQDKFRFAENHLLQSLELLNGDTTSTEYARTMISLSGVYVKQKLFNKAFTYSSSAMLIAKKKGNTKIHASAALNTATTLKESGKNEEAKIYAREAIQAYAEMGDSLAVSYAYNTLGMIAKNLENYEEAHGFYDTSLALRVKYGTPLDQISVLGNVAILYKKEGKLDEALNCYTQLIKLADEKKSDYLKAAVLINLGELLLLKGDTVSALSRLDSCLFLAESNNFVEQQKDIYKILSEVNFAQKRYELAWGQKEKYLELQDELLSEDLEATIEELQLIYDSRGKQIQIDELKLENAKNFMIFHLILITLLILTLILFYLRTIKLKRAKQAIKASEGKFRMLAENSTEVIWSCDLDLNLTYISPSTEKLFGYPREERLKKPMGEVFSTDSVKKLQQYVKSFKGKKNHKIDPLVLELRGVHNHGHEVWVEITTDFAFDENGKLSGLQGIAHDITDRKNAELGMLKLVENLSRQDVKLKEQNEELLQARQVVEKTAEQYFDLFEKGPVGYLILNEKGTVTELNSTSSQIIGYEKQEIIHKDFSMFIREEEQSLFSGLLSETLKEKQVKQQEFNISGISAKIVFVPDSIDGILKCRLALVDISGEVQVREELSLALQSLQTVFEAIPGGIAVVDKELKIVNINKRMRKIHQIENHSDFVGKKCFEVFNCGHKPCDDCTWQQVIDTQKTIVRNSTPGDKVYKNGFYRIYSSPIFDEQGKVTGIVEAVMDISNLKKAEFALKESERKFEDLFKEIPDAVFITGIGEESGQIVDVNPEAEKQTGYSREELLKMNVLNDISENSSGSALTGDREHTLLNNDKIELTERKLRKDGTYVWTEVVIQRIVIEGKPLALSVSRDITERVEIQETLQKSESRVLSILNALPDLLFVFNKEGCFLEYHANSTDKLILSPEQFLNQKVEDVLSPELTKLTMEKMESTFRTREMQLYGYSLIINGMKHYFDARMVKASEDSVLTIVRDITEARRAEKAKKQNEEKYETLFMNTPLGVFNFDSESTIITCNETLEKIIGSDRKQLTGFNIIKSAGDEELKIALKDSLQRGSGYYEGNYKSITSGKQTPIKAFFKSIFDEQGKFVDGMGIVEDVTEQKKYEENLLDALKRAEQSDKLKSTFMATMSHELRTPLNTVIGFADIIEDSMPIDQILEFSSVISKSGRHLLSIIEDILDISLIDSGESKMVIETFYLAELMEGLYNFASRERITLNKDYLQIKLKLQDELKELKLAGDIRKINKVFSHLTKNALKFTREGEIEIGVKKPNGSNSKGELLFYVKDTGIGIPKDKHDVIFEIFRQVDDSSTREFEGTGLGLSISKKLIQLMGGKIWLESEPENLSAGKTGGSTFFFQLPLLSGAAKAYTIQNKHNKPEVKSTKGIHVIVAEDDDTNFHLFRLLLTRKKMKVTRARNGEEAVDMISSDDSISLVLMDINMPVLNGYDATRRIKEIRNDLPVIAVTAYAMSGDKMRAEEAGCDDYITKPINNIIFYETIAKFV